MTIEEKVRKILSPLLNLSEDYAIEYGDCCVICGFPLNKKKREKMISEATQTILALIKPMSRERLIKLIANHKCSYPFIHRNDNTYIGDNNANGVATAILAEWEKGLK